MVAKIGHGTSLFGAIAYNKIKVDEEKGKVLFARNIIERGDGTYRMSDILYSFEPYLTANKRTEKPVIHISINPDPRDNVSDESFTEIARKYMDELGFGEQPYIVFKHTDIDRTHIHIVSVRVKIDGSSISDTYEKRRSMDICRTLEQKYNLTPIDKQKRKHILPLNKVDYSKGNVKRQVSNALRELTTSYHFQSFGEYRALLSLFNLTVDEVKGTYKGAPYNGLVYSTVNDKGEKIGNPYKASLFGKSVGYEALQRKINMDKALWRKDRINRGRLKDEIHRTIFHSKNRKSFENKLLKKRISVVFRENKQGRIYGVTFIDHDTKNVFNGSRLGKDFSANIFQEWFVNGEKPSTVSTIPFKTEEDVIESNLFVSDENKTEPGRDLLSMFTIEAYGEDYEDELFKLKMRKRKKKNKKPKL